MLLLDSDFESHLVSSVAKNAQTNLCTNKVSFCKQHIVLLCLFFFYHIIRLSIIWWSHTQWRVWHRKASLASSGSSVEWLTLEKRVTLSFVLAVKIAIIRLLPDSNIINTALIVGSTSKCNLVMGNIAWTINIFLIVKEINEKRFISIEEAHVCA